MVVEVSEAVELGRHHWKYPASLSVLPILSHMQPSAAPGHLVSRRGWRIIAEQQQPLGAIPVTWTMNIISYISSHKVLSTGYKMYYI